MQRGIRPSEALIEVTLPDLFLLLTKGKTGETLHFAGPNGARPIKRFLVELEDEVTKQDIIVFLEDLRSRLQKFPEYQYSDVIEEFAAKIDRCGVK